MYRIFYSEFTFTHLYALMFVILFDRTMFPNYSLFFTHKTIKITILRVNVVESQKIDCFIAITDNSTEMRAARCCQNEVTSMTFIDWCSSNYAVFSFIALCCLLFIGVIQICFYFMLFKRIAINLHDTYFCHLTRSTIQHFQNEFSRRSVVRNFAIDIPTIDSKLNHSSFECFIVR